jgi:phospholipid/cholesterol/gamma-HCH transport system ATP-binding protein
MIEVQNLHKSFGSLDVLREVSFRINDGETFAIIGRSGSGKSVLMKHLVGLHTPDEGRVLVDEIDINELPYNELRKVRRRFGVLFQGGALFDSMSASENVAFPLRTFSEMEPGEIDAHVQRCLEMVELPDVRDQKPAELSGGMKKRVALARAVAMEPEYILYDEPTSGLDPDTSNTINDLINGLADQLNVTSVVVTHDMHSVLEISDRALFLHEARAHWIGTVEELHESTDSTLLDFVKASEYHIGSSASKPEIPRP